MKVLALPRYTRLGASSRLRLYAYRPYLEAAGFDVRYEPLLDDSYLENLYAGRRRHQRDLLPRYWRRLRSLLTRRPADIVWIEKDALPWVPFLETRLISRLAVRSVVDFDDAWMLRYARNGSAVVRSLLSRKLEGVVRTASLTVAANGTLETWARGAGAPSVACVPTVVDPDDYPVCGHRDGHRPRVVWIGSPPNTHYLEPVLPALAEACRAFDAELILIGAGDLPGGDLPVRRLAWSEDREKADLADCDVGIMPLPDAEWERGKSGFKIIQYMAAGLPVVASPVGANCDIVTPDVGFLAGSADDWSAALRTLLSNPSLRQQMGAAGRRRIERHYSIRTWGPWLAERFAALLGGTAR